MEEEKCPKCGGIAHIWHELDAVSLDDDYTCTCFKCTNCEFIFDWITGDIPDCEYYKETK